MTVIGGLIDPTGPLVPLRANRSVFLPLWNNVDYSGEVWREAPPPEEEEEDDEEEQEGNGANEPHRSNELIDIININVSK